MRNSISKGISSWFAELSRSGGGVRAVKLVLCAAVLAEAAGAQPSADWRIDTVAGTGESLSGFGGFGGDGGPATNAQLASPVGVAVDGAGNLYIADRRNNRIRKVDSTGTISTIAGTGEYGDDGDDGDGGPATEARLRSPTGVAVDGAGNLYIADRNNHRIRKVDSTGTISTIAGTGNPAYYRGQAGDHGPATNAQLLYPTGVALDGAGNLYIADEGQHRIRKVDSTGTIRHFAGLAGQKGFRRDGHPAVKALLNQPADVAVDGAGNLYIADSINRRVRKVDSLGFISTIAGTGNFPSFNGPSGDRGPATNAQLAYPQVWRWTARATSTSPIMATTGSARWTLRGRSAPSRGREGPRRGSVGTAARRPRPG